MLIYKNKLPCALVIKIAMRKKELEIQMEQVALQELDEDHRQRVAAAKLDEVE